MEFFTRLWSPLPAPLLLPRSSFDHEDGAIDGGDGGGGIGGGDEGGIGGGDEGGGIDGSGGDR